MSRPRLVSAATFYDRLADGYEQEFEAPHRRAYDDLAWETVSAHLPSAPSVVVDVGCGVGRWSARLVAAGHRVVGFDPSAAMVAEARARDLGPRFTIRQAGVEDVEIEEGTTDAVLAMGSLQYAGDPAAAIARMARWLRPGGMVAVLCDSRLALALELLADDRVDEAVERAASGEARYRKGELVVAHRLFDAATLRAAFSAAGLVDVGVSGLLVSWSAHGRTGAMARLADDPEHQMAVERRLARCPPLADAGKQLLAIGRRPGPSP